MSNLGHEKLIHFKYSQWKSLWHFEFKACDCSTLTSIHIKIVTVTVVCPAIFEEIKSRCDINHNKVSNTPDPNPTESLKVRSKSYRSHGFIDVAGSLDVGDIFQIRWLKNESVTNILNLSPTETVQNRWIVQILFLKVYWRIERETFFENRDNFFFSSYLVNSKAEIGGTAYFSVLVSDSFTDVKWCKGKF